MKNYTKRFQILLILSLMLLPIQSVFGQTEYELMIEVEKLINDGKLNKAIKSCDQIIAGNPQNYGAYISKSNVLVELEKYDEAITALNDGLEANPEEAWLYNQRALLYQSYGMTYPALRDYKKGIEFAKNDTMKNTLWMNQATAKSSLREFEASYKILQKCFAFDSTNLGVLNNLATVCDEIGKPELTEYYLLKVIKIDSLFIGGYVNLGFMYQGREEYEKSITYFDKALEIQPDEAYSYSNRSYSKLKIGDVKGALDDVNKSLELYPGNSYAYRNRALIYIEMDKMKKACEDLQLAIDWKFTQAYGKEVVDLQGKYCR
ncbi:MAG: tetratricopeptide repeat protein [Crocinitomix sp.]|nr:tetratricopeptide repeat protein [Crocinitomix sp.]